MQSIAHVRPFLDAQNVLAASRLNAMPKNLVCKIGGLVITRQRPGTAKGFVSLTIEDETGLVNVIVRPDVYERNRRTILTSQCLIVEGVLQKRVRLCRRDHEALLAAGRLWRRREGPRAKLSLMGYCSGP
ncbi:MAG TPA: OB-fold nucleic acid binding domain-containing protein [Candidatus Elarobacter sp.]|nr:OB-fold nucleic acid binding domain-containing protein [Candidatus Elarobacter sp.]